MWDGRWLGHLLLVVLLGSALPARTATAAAQGMLVCQESDAATPSGAEELAARWSTGDPAAALSVVDRLAHAWDEGDASAALALFADDAVASAPGSRWQGKRELAGFLDRMWDPMYASRVSPVRTTSRCAAGDGVEWRFAYPEAGAIGAVDLVVHGGLIQRIYWHLTGASSASSTAVEVEPVAWEEVSALPLGLGFLIVLGVLYRRRRTDQAGPARQQAHLLRALRDARLERLGSRPPNR